VNREAKKPRGTPASDRETVLRSFLLAFGTPGREQRNLILSSDWIEDLASRGWLADRDPESLRKNLPDDDAEWESFFLSTFDVGLPAPPVPLFETHYLKEGSISAVLHENILYYKKFGGELAKGDADGADHLRHQLGFLRFLFWLEDHPDTPPETARGARLARTDFIRRHLLNWVPKAAKTARKKAHPLWEALLAALSVWLAGVAEGGKATHPD
jgi:TorA maturation chaperone TorD